MRLKKLLSFASLCLVLVTSAVAGPFGLEKGMTLQQLQQHGTFVPMKDKPYIYSARTLRNGHSAFEEYQVVVDPALGLCKIFAVGKDIETSVYGDEVKSDFKDLADALKAKYGRPAKEYNFLSAGSIWNEPRDFTMGLVKKERHLSTYWDAGLQDNLEAVMLTARALNASKGFLILEYEFNNSTACLQNSKKVRNSNL